MAMAAESALSRLLAVDALAWQGGGRHAPLAAATGAAAAQHATRTSSSVVVGEVSALKHELGNDAVEDAALVAVALLSGAQGAEVLGGLGDIGEELKGDALGGSIADADVEENFLRGGEGRG